MKPRSRYYLSLFTALLGLVAGGIEIATATMRYKDSEVK